MASNKRLSAEFSINHRLGRLGSCVVVEQIELAMLPADFAAVVSKILRW